MTEDDVVDEPSAADQGLKLFASLMFGFNVLKQQLVELTKELDTAADANMDLNVRKSIKIRALELRAVYTQAAATQLMLEMNRAQLELLVEIHAAMGCTARRDN